MLPARPREPCVFESVRERIPAQAPWGDTVHGVSLGSGVGVRGRKAGGRRGASGSLAGRAGPLGLSRGGAGVPAFGVASLCRLLSPLLLGRERPEPLGLGPLVLQ